jgi:hypothetical protein
MKQTLFEKFVAQGKIRQEVLTSSNYLVAGDVCPIHNITLWTSMAEIMIIYLESILLGHELYATFDKESRDFHL